MNKRILLSSVSIFASIALVAGATFAFFSDTETSAGNTFTAGAIDLTIDNTSYLNGVFNQGTSWLQPADLDDGNGPAGGSYFFFDFDDIKPGDYGEDTISLHVDSNDAWACVDVTLTSNDDVSSTEPELEDNDVPEDNNNNADGELASAVNFIWWADDGDNVFEDDELLLPAGPLGLLGVGGKATVALAENQNSIYAAGKLSVDPLTTGSLIGEDTYYIGKAWCFGNLVADQNTAEAQDNLGPDLTPGDPSDSGSNGPDVRSAGFTCDGTTIADNKTQTDEMTATITFRAVQARNNESFLCNT